MAAKRQKLKTFNVQKRFTVWGEVKIKAATFEEAVQKGREIEYTDMADAIQNEPDAAWIDFTEEPGFGVTEDW